MKLTFASTLSLGAVLARADGEGSAGQWRAPGSDDCESIGGTRQPPITSGD